jgi:hypothetical protein
LKQWVAVCVGLMTLVLGGAGNANAQVTFFGPGYYGGYYGPRFYQPRYVRPGLAPSQVIRIVQAAGYSPLGAPERRGPNYVVAAVGRGSGQMWVVVDAYEGAIINVQPVRRLYGGLVPYDPRLATVPPIPNQRLMNGPVTGSVTSAPMPPARTPVPRARPSVASNDAATAPAATPVPAAPPAAASSTDAPEGPPAPLRPKPATPMVPVAPLD